MKPLPPGTTIGVIGSGQLGRMLSVAAAQLGYQTHIFAPQSGPANDVSAGFTRGAYDDEEALAVFASHADVVTYEFENIPAGPIEALSKHVPVHPSPAALAVAQDRIAEKTFAEKAGGRTAPWRAVNGPRALEEAIAEIGCPAILKTTRFGYDGKGQARLMTPEDARHAWEAIGGRPAILEGFVKFDAEFSIVLARGTDGSIVTWPAPKNEHKDGILSLSTVPAPKKIAAQHDEAVALASRIAQALDHVGVLTLEFFASADGPIFNEMAPRVHNSGHWTIEGAVTSQFENHVRAICGLPLGPTALTGRKVTMTNLIGEDALPENVAHLLAEPGAHLHLYGKHEVREGRKMGHVTRVTR
ncbi:5-(carboxyamino)imidazole ribonucleotide synthase [Stakelama tenebrarum]|uniref:N5-carboxyaminoimidazole ribonucleotide synthase n=1 Tax=Stakelama tenebrarum TaxID=2711215 RepID=A0A6G6Y8Z4_9SPHN|nr:5-(carboxyamino)imidazole ribonucleotide synthase [Sphingosinithalassobacter tenebrarum]QIG81412.1 5-(carboxyamino)imidazole ribonucleotide synthase [Sphingosinithalassobacter tenebrarum]